MNISNKYAIVTGSSKGIGLSTAKLLLENNVFVIGINRTKAPIQHPNYQELLLDLSNEQALKNIPKSVFEKCAILINNAGYGFLKPAEETTLDEWKKVFDVNVHALFYLCAQCIPTMKKNGEGHIINISSIAGKTGTENFSAYCATKYAVRGFSESLYKEVRDYGVKVTCIFPGSVKTDFFNDINAITANDNMMQAEDIAKNIIQILETNTNYHPVELEIRPLMPKGRKSIS